MKPRTVTRSTVANPIYWLAIGALNIGTFMESDVPWWSFVLACAVIAALTNAIDRWYVTARAKVIATQGIVDAAAMRPDVFVSTELGNSVVPDLRRPTR